VFVVGSAAAVIREHGVEGEQRAARADAGLQCQRRVRVAQRCESC
jgi:hypothetical protein